MITKIKVHNRFNMDLVANGMKKIEEEDWYLISIYPPQEDVSLEFLTESNRKTMIGLGCRGGASLCFSDITKGQFEREIVNYPFLTMLSLEQINEIFSLIEVAMSDPDEVTLVLHCDAGISRSGAVAQFVADIWKIPFRDAYIKPNPDVYRALVNAYADKMYEEDKEK